MDPILHPERAGRMPEVENRRLLLAGVAQNPGAHLRELGRRSSLALGTALYHLDRLEREGLVVALRDGRYRRYFPAHSFGAAEKEMLSMLRHATPRQIILALLDTGAVTQRGLCERTGISRSTISFHMTQLVARGIVRRTEERAPGTHGDRQYVLESAGLAGITVERFGVSLHDAPALAGG